jgi:hypothetical protein
VVGHRVRRRLPMRVRGGPNWRTVT